MLLLYFQVLLYQQWQTNQELDKRNVQIETQNKELHAKNEQIERQNKDLDAKSDSIQTANDSINKQKCELEKAYNDLKRSNWQTQTNYAKLSIEQANRLMEDDYYIEAREKMLSILPSSINNPDKPFIPESEETFRRSLDYNSLAFPRISSSIGANQLACNMFATLIASYSNDYIALWDRNTRKFKYQITHIKSIKSVNFSFLTSDNLIIVKEGKENDSIIIWNIDKQIEDDYVELEKPKLQDDQDIELGNGSDGLIVIKSFDRYVDLNGTEDFNKEMDDRLSRFKQLDCFELFTSHTCTSVDEYGYKRYFREYAIDFGKDAEGAARLISEILQKVNGWTLETNFDMLTNVGDDADKARREWLEAHGFGGYEGDIDDDNDVSANQKYQLASQEYNGTQKSNSSDNIGIETTQTPSQPVKQEQQLITMQQKSTQHSSKC